MICILNGNLLAPMFAVSDMYLSLVHDGIAQLMV